LDVYTRKEFGHFTQLDLNLRKSSSEHDLSVTLGDQTDGQGEQSVAAQGEQGESVA
jgi:hypothetical protein